MSEIRPNTMNSVTPWVKQYLQTCLVAGCALLLLGALLGVGIDDNWSYLAHSWLLNFFFYLTISMGCLFIVLIMHLVKAGWGVQIRRLAEILANNQLILVLLFIPIWFSLWVGSSVMYEWVSPELVAEDELLAHKAPYLNFTFFTARVFIYFGVWWLLSRYYLSKSLQQDEDRDPEHTKDMEWWSGPAVLAFALTLTFAAFDWLMSLDPHWFSTIYGVYIFAGCAVAGFATLILLCIILQHFGRLTDTITAEHYHDMGKLLFGFLFFWGYVAFSQYMLIWYANIPEETGWYLERIDWSTTWPYTGIVIVIFGFFVPFLFLLSRWMKRVKVRLAFWAGYLLAFHWLDLAFNVMPGAKLYAQGEEVLFSFPVHFVDVCLFFGMGLIYFGAALKAAEHLPLIPKHDPRLGESLAFENY